MIVENDPNYHAPDELQHWINVQVGKRSKRARRRQRAIVDDWRV